MSQEAGHLIFKGNIQHFDLKKDGTALGLHSWSSALHWKTRTETGQPLWKRPNYLLLRNVIGTHHPEIVAIWHHWWDNTDTKWLHRPTLQNGREKENRSKHEFIQEHKVWEWKSSTKNPAPLQVQRHARLQNSSGLADSPVYFLPFIYRIVCLSGWL